MAICNDSTRSRVPVSSASFDAALSAYLQCVSRLESEASIPEALFSFRCLELMEREFSRFYRSHLDYLRFILDGFDAGGEA